MGTFRFLYAVRFILVLFCVWSSALLSAGTRDVYLAFGEKGIKATVQCREYLFDGYPVSIPAVFWHPLITEEGIDFTTEEILNIINELEAIFEKRGKIYNLNFTTIKPDNPAITVYFQKKTCALEGVAIDDLNIGDAIAGMDRFDVKKTGAVVVMFADLSEIEFDLGGLPRNLAHEIAHTFGSLHINPPIADDPKRESVMNDRYPGQCPSGCLGDKFLGLATRTESPKYTHNPQYYIRRYVGGEADATLQQEGLCPGTWDLTLGDDFRKWLLKMKIISPSNPSNANTNTVSQLTGPITELFNITLLVNTGRGFSKEAQVYPSLSLDQPIQIEYPMDLFSQFQILASSASDVAPDILLAKESGPVEGVEFFSSVHDGEQLRLVRAIEGGEYETVANVSISFLPDDVFVNSFEQGSTSNSTSLQAETTADEGNCAFEYLEVLKDGTGKGTVIGESALNEISEVINCGPECSNQINTLAFGDVVKLTATPDPITNSKFILWTGVEECEASDDLICYVPMIKSQQITAVFESCGDFCLTHQGDFVATGQLSIYDGTCVTSVSRQFTASVRMGPDGSYGQLGLTGQSSYEVIVNNSPISCGSSYPVGYTYTRDISSGIWFTVSSNIITLENPTTFEVQSAVTIGAEFTEDGIVMTYLEQSYCPSCGGTLVTAAPTLLIPIP